jgi:hypothetical protein
MHTTPLAWRTLVRRQWPLACALLLLLVIEGYKRLDYPLSQWWELLGTLAISALAVLAPRHPFRAALTAAAALVVSIVVEHLLLLDGETGTFDGLMHSERVAFMALIAIILRQASPLRAALGTAALVAATSVGIMNRMSRWDQLEGGGHPGGFAWTNLTPSVWFLALAIGTGLLFRVWDRRQPRLVGA